MIKKTNVFKVGEEVSKGSFFGRADDLAKLENEIIGKGSNSGINGARKTLSIVGLHRIGKSSIVQKFIDDTLLNEDDIIVVRKRLNEDIRSDKNTGVLSPAMQFWYTLILSLKFAIKEKDKHLEKFEKELEKILDGFFTEHGQASFSFNICRFFDNLCKDSYYRVILILDEFDAADTLFKGCEGNFGVLRTIAGSTQNSVTMITVSRRSIDLIAKDVHGVSPFRGTFTEMDISPFNAMDVEIMYKALGEYGIFIVDDEELRKKLVYYAGNHPYLLSMYSHDLVELTENSCEISGFDLDKIRYRRANDIEAYYDTAINRFKNDGFIDVIYGIVLGPRVRVSENDVIKLVNKGYLCADVNSGGYYCISHDFAEYLRRMYRPNIPLWYAIMHSEKIIRSFVRKTYPRLDEYMYTVEDSLEDKRELRDYIYTEYGIHISNYKEMENRIHTAENYGQHATICDAFTLGFMIDIIENNWIKFSTYFDKNSCIGFDFWKKHFDILKRVRNPLAHSKPEYITVAEEQFAADACELIAKLCPEIPRDWPETSTDMQDKTE